MVTKAYVTNPQLTSPGTPDTMLLAYTLIEWAEGSPGIIHPPGNEDTIIFLAFGDTAGMVRQKIIDNVVAHLGVASNDVYFIPEIGTGA